MITTNSESNTRGKEKLHSTTQPWRSTAEPRQPGIMDLAAQFLVPDSLTLNTLEQARLFYCKLLTPSNLFKTGYNAQQDFETFLTYK